MVEQHRARVSLTAYTGSVCALIDAAHAPASLGLRTANLVLRPLVEENINNEFTLLSPQFTSDQAVDKIELQVGNLNRLAGIGNKRSVSTFFGHGIELIHMPYYVCKSTDDDGPVFYLMDAVTGRIETDFRESTWVEGRIQGAQDPGYGSLSLTLHRCGNCGEDLSDSDALVVICDNCNTLTTLDNAIQPELILGVVPSRQMNVDLYLPFWVFALRDEESARLKHAFGSMSPLSQAFVPAFEIRNSEALHRTIIRASLSLTESSASELSSFEHNFMPASEKVDSAKSKLRASYLRAQLERTNHLVENDSLRVGALKALTYVPFRIENYFLVDCCQGTITIEKVPVLGSTASFNS